MSFTEIEIGKGGSTCACRLQLLFETGSKDEVLSTRFGPALCESTHLHVKHTTSLIDQRERERERGTALPRMNQTHQKKGYRAR